MRLHLKQKNNSSKRNNKAIITVPFITVLSLASLAVWLPAISNAAPLTVTVNSTNDGSDVNQGDGICETSTPSECTLRAAIEETNSNTNPSDVDVINFGISGGGIHTITPAAIYDPFVQPVRVNGASQGSVNCTTHSLLIEIDGSSLGVGPNYVLKLGSGSDGSTVNAVSIINSPLIGLSITGDDNTVTCNNIGVGANGTTVAGNDDDGIGITGSTNNLTVGGSSAALGNLIANNDAEGMHFEGSNDYTNSLIRFNTFSDNTQHGLLGTTPLTGSYTDTFVRDNTFDSNNGGGVTFEGGDNLQIYDNTSINNSNDGIAMTETVNSTAYNNESSDNEQAGISIIDGDTLDIHDNMIDGNGETGIGAGGAANVTIDSNTVNDNDGSGINLNNTDDSFVTNNRTTANGANGINLVGDSSNVDVFGNVSGGNVMGVSMSDTSEDTIRGNFIGVDDDGVTGTNMSNSGGGVVLLSIGGSYATDDNVIGGTTAGDRNIISNNGTSNIVMFGGGGTVTGNQVIGNYIGTNASGTVVSAYTDTPSGILVVGGVDDNVIGGTTANRYNLIRGNNIGIQVTSSSLASLFPLNLSILGNKNYDNQEGVSPGLAIDLNNDSDVNFVADADLGPDTNDAGDPDNGSNYKLNHPVISNITTDGGDVTITYSLDINDTETDATGYRVEFFANDEANPSGFGDGQTFIGADTVSGDVTDKTVTFSTSLTTADYQFAATTTATDVSDDGFGGTSEHSEVLGASVINDNPDPDSGSGSGSGNSSNGDSDGLGETGTNSVGPSIIALAILVTSVLGLSRQRRRKITN